MFCKNSKIIHELSQNMSIHQKLEIENFLYFTTYTECRKSKKNEDIFDLGVINELIFNIHGSSLDKKNCYVMRVIMFSSKNLSSAVVSKLRFNQMLLCYF